MGNAMALNLKFTPEISVGDIFKALVVIISIGGYAGATYLQAERQFDSVDRRFALIEQRLEQDEKETLERATAQRDHDAKVSSSLDKISDALGNLAVLVAASNHESRR
jgi:hypothetical protein